MKNLALVVLCLSLPLAHAHRAPLTAACMDCIQQTVSQSPAEMAFEKLKGLAGTWAVVGSDAKVTFEVASEGSIVIERDFGDMTTVYHLDGATLLMTHYCSIGNQPRLRATNFSDPNSLTFDFVDVSNTKANQGHINALTTQWLDTGNVKEMWTYLQPDGTSGVENFEITRVAQ